MKNYVQISNIIKKFNRVITVQGDKSISIRWALMASQAVGKSRANNLLKSEDVESTLTALKKLGVKVLKNKKYCEIIGKGLNSYSFRNNTIINAGNSGTLARLILGLLSNSNKSVIIKGDKSLSKRDFSRIIKPLNIFGVKVKSNKNKLPVILKGTNYLRPIYFEEKKGSAQVKSCIMMASLNTHGTTIIKCVNSRDHTERLFNYLKIPIIIKKLSKTHQLIKIQGKNQYNAFNYNIPGDISSAAFFLVLTALSKNSKIIIKNVNINKTRTGIIDILKKMNVNIKIKNNKLVNNESVGDIYVKSANSLKAINCNSEINSRAIDEFPLIFLLCAKAKGISFFKKIGELRHKESDRLKVCSDFLKSLGVKTIEGKDSLKIYGNPNLKIEKKINIKNFMQDHRIFMMSCIAALTLGGEWKINDKNSIKTSFPNFILTLKRIGAIIK